MKILITTWDQSSSILTAFAVMADKYVPSWSEIEFQMLGYTVFPPLSERYKCVSVGKKQTSWTRDYFNYIRNIPDEFVIFGTDDLLFVGDIDWEVFTHTFQLMKDDPTIGRYELGVGHNWHKKITQLEDCGTYKIYQYGKDSLYRISCQFSIWRRSYLLRYLNFDRTAWEFEIEGSKEAVNDGMNIIATRGRVAFPYIHTVSTKRYPGKINVAGMQYEDIEKLVEMNLLNPAQLQLGEEPNSPPYI